MPPHRIVALLIRLFSIGYLIYAIRSVSNFVMYFASTGENLPELFLACTVIAMLFLFCVTWFFPYTIAGWLIGRADLPEAPPAWSNDEIFTTVFIFVGLVWLYWAASDALYWFFYFIVASPDGGWGTLLPDTQASVLATVVELMLALSLILGASGWKSLLFRLRYGKSMGPDRKDSR